MSIAQAHAVCKRRFIPRPPEQNGLAERFANAGYGVFGAEVTMRKKYGIDFFLFEPLGNQIGINMVVVQQPFLV
ncbi:hypothetical protein D3C73_1503190 [compost metagenome]